MPDGVAALQAFITRQTSAAELSQTGRWAGTASFLDAMGALTFEPSWLYDTSRLGIVFRSLMLEWYADYYSHPFWTTLLSGDATIEQLARWISRTYHLSRSVGASAARGAIHSSNEQCRLVFRQNALEEYDHCRIFYGIDENLDPRIAALIRKGQEPLSRSIDFHFLSMAEADQWGHALSALFQEQTAMFSGDVRANYNHIEKTYGLDRLFDGWRKHLSVDIDGDHAGHFANLFESSSALSFVDSAVALLNAWATANLLRQSLDEVSGSCHSTGSFCPTGRRYAVTRLGRIALNAMAHAHCEDDVVAAGDLLSAIDRYAENISTSDIDEWSSSLHQILMLNELQMRATDSKEFKPLMASAVASGPLSQILSEIRSLIRTRSHTFFDAPLDEQNEFSGPDIAVSLPELLGH